MLECAGQTADNRKSKALPQFDGTLVCAHHKIELHSGEAALACALQGIRAHGASHAASDGPGGGHVRAIGHMGSPGLLVRPQEVGSEHAGIFLSEKDFVPVCEPVIEGLLAGHFARSRRREWWAPEWPKGHRRHREAAQAGCAWLTFAVRQDYVNLAQNPESLAVCRFPASFVKLQAWPTSSVKLPRRSARSRRDSA